MKYCKSCHILYSDAAGACPKCGVIQPEKAPAKNDAPQQSADKRSVRRDWLWIAVGVPLFIGLIYLLVYLIKIS